MIIIRTKGWDFNTVFYSCRCEYYINTSCRMTQIKDTSISFKSEQCHVCYHYQSCPTSSYREMLAGCSFNCTAYVGHTEVEVVSVCTGCMQYVIKGYKCFTMLRRTTYTTYTRSDRNPMFPQQRFPHILLYISQHYRQNEGKI